MYKTIERGFTTVPLEVFPVNCSFRLKSAEHDITLTSFVTDLSHPGLSTLKIMCEIDTRKGAGSSTVTRASCIALEDIAIRKRTRRGCE